ncbi:uncharacterized protein METZ01_LOCUS61788 [marine metagenome]|uniref:Uncharacterized protein n=1 Tax=marine metagenome TaxID=408172 RepID=A0A381SZS9_9ZZZZ
MVIHHPLPAASTSPLSLYRQMLVSRCKCVHPNYPTAHKSETCLSSYGMYLAYRYNSGSGTSLESTV